jgi:hypothetical protein
MITGGSSVRRPLTAATGFPKTAAGRFTWICHTLRRLAHAPVQESSARSAMFIVKGFGEPQAPLGAAREAETTTSEHVPPLTELGRGSVGRRSYKHGAPDGAFAASGNRQIWGLGLMPLGNSFGLLTDCPGGTSDNSPRPPDPAPWGGGGVERQWTQIFPSCRQWRSVG